MRGQLRAQKEELARDARLPSRRKRKCDDKWKFSKRVRHVLLIVYTSATFASRPAVVYLGSCGRSRHWQDKSGEELAQLVSN